MAGSFTTQTAEFWATIASVPLIGTLAIFMFKNRVRLADDVLKLNQSLSAHKLFAAESFATKVDLKEDIDRVEGQLKRIEEKLDKLIMGKMR